MSRHHLDHILAQRPAGRLMSVDILRGLAIAAMVLVNNPGSWSYVYAPMAHAQWHGWTPTDVIFPLFLFVVGLSIVLATGKNGEFPRVGKTQWTRAVKLFGLGLFLAVFFYNFRDSSYSWLNDRVEGIRWMGVLQRIALVYIASCYLVRWLPVPGLVVAAIACSLLPWLLMLWMPYQADSGEFFRGQLLFGNHFSAWLDQALFGNRHVYYRDAQPFAFDPEGLLTTFPAISTCLLGILAGLSWKCASDATPQKLWKYWLVWGVLMFLAGQTMHPWVPVNKALWSPSFVLVTAGISLILLAGLYYLVDIRERRRVFAPLLVLGVNAIALFMLAGVVGRLFIMIPVADTTLKGWLFSSVFQPLFGSYGGSLAFAACCLGLFYGVMWQMYRRRIFWKV
ncbi:acyltransferase family protein [Microbulbifer aggregans]|uniref:acyltransferase family protein n=1 Tax=Microbulbifer aggregans TaxID=1769779 RepID=UPI001CFEC124|nr:heparan-alpha-glucosaminide N-acetyltransferase domain-containing protein [Microbulbifer aggregans]